MRTIPSAAKVTSFANNDFSWSWTSQSVRTVLRISSPYSGLHILLSTALRIAQIEIPFIVRKVLRQNVAFNSHRHRSPKTSIITCQTHFYFHKKKLHLKRWRARSRNVKMWCCVKFVYCMTSNRNLNSPSNRFSSREGKNCCFIVSVGVSLFFFVIRGRVCKLRKYAMMLWVSLELFDLLTCF